MFIFIKINSMWTNQFIFTKNNYNYITIYSLFNILILMIYNIDFILFLHYTDSIFLRFLHKEGLMMIRPQLLKIQKKS